MHKIQVPVLAETRVESDANRSDRRVPVELVDVQLGDRGTLSTGGGGVEGPEPRIAGCKGSVSLHLVAGRVAPRVGRAHLKHT